jgi:hypothetical protein
MVERFREQRLADYAIWRESIDYMRAVGGGRESGRRLHVKSDGILRCAIEFVEYWTVQGSNETEIPNVVRYVNEQYPQIKDTRCEPRETLT